MTRAVSILERPVYGVAEAAGLLGLWGDRTRAWLDGYERRGVRYPPVVRSEPTGEDIVTWGEFVELGYLREYRRKGVPLQQLRPVIEGLRQEFGTPYPLATAKPFLYGKELVLELQQRNDLPAALAIVIRSGQTIALAGETQRFLQKVEFHPPGDGDACRLMPAGKASPVVIDPLVRMGEVHGLEDLVLAEAGSSGQFADTGRAAELLGQIISGASNQEVALLEAADGSEPARCDRAHAV
jgi:hypothetical protein